jgi:hypothetical protein
MLNNISWGLFILYTSGALVVYYVLLIVVKGSGWKRKNKSTQGWPLFNARDFTNTEATTTDKDAGEEKERKSANSQVLQSIVHDVVDEIQAYFSVLEKDADKNEMLSQLASIVKKYPTIKGSIYEESINSLIGVSIQHHCSILISDTDVSSLWN